MSTKLFVNVVSHPQILSVQTEIASGKPIQQLLSPEMRVQRILVIIDKKASIASLQEHASSILKSLLNLIVEPSGIMEEHFCYVPPDYIVGDVLESGSECYLVVDSIVQAPFKQSSLLPRKAITDNEDLGDLANGDGIGETASKRRRQGVPPTLLKSSMQSTPPPQTVINTLPAPEKDKVDSVETAPRTDKPLSPHGHNDENGSMIVQSESTYNLKTNTVPSSITPPMASGQSNPNRRWSSVGLENSKVRRRSSASRHASEIIPKRAPNEPASTRIAPVVLPYTMTSPRVSSAKNTPEKAPDDKPATSGGLRSLTQVTVPAPRKRGRPRKYASPPPTQHTEKAGASTRKSNVPPPVLPQASDSPQKPKPVKDVSKANNHAERAMRRQEALAQHKHVPSQTSQNSSSIKPNRNEKIQKLPNSSSSASEGSSDQESDQISESSDDEHVRRRQIARRKPVKAVRSVSNIVKPGSATSGQIDRQEAPARSKEPVLSPAVSLTRNDEDVAAGLGARHNQTSNSSSSSAARNPGLSQPSPKSNGNKDSTTFSSIPGLEALPKLTSLTIPEVHERPKRVIPSLSTQTQSDTEEEERDSHSSDSSGSSDSDDETPSRAGNGSRFARAASQRLRGGLLKDLFMGRNK